MARIMTEDDMLRELEIDDWRHMTKDKIVHFASNLHKMDPEVAKKALEQFPNFTTYATGIVNHYKEVIEKVLDTHAKGSQEYYNMCNVIIESLKEELKRDDISYEQRREIINDMVSLSEKVALKNKEDQHFLGKIAGIFAIIVVALIGFVATALGGSSGNDDD